MGDSYTPSFQMQRAQIAQFAKEPKTIRDIEQLGYLLNNTVPTLLGTKVDETRLLIAGAGLTGGGDLTADITFNVGQGVGMIINADDIAIDLVAEAERIRDVMGTALIDTATIDFTADDAADTIKADLKNTTVTPGAYTSANITVDAQGRITAASSGSVAAGSIGPTELASTSVTPGSYTNTNLTVDADGRITAASNGSAGGGSSRLASGYTSVPSTATTAEEFLYTYTLPAGTLATDGQCLKIIIAGRLAGNTRSKQVKLYFGAQVTTAVNTSSSTETTWRAEYLLMRTAAATQRLTGFEMRGPQNNTTTTPFTASVTPAETLSGTVDIKVSSTVGAGASASDVILDQVLIEFVS